MRQSTFSDWWLLWMAVAAVACLPPLGVPPMLALAVACALFIAWICINVPAKQLVTGTIFMAIEIFFRELVARNRFKVPPEGTPCIFVCAPHANQFLDPFVVMRAVGRADLCYLTAQKTMRRRVLGLLARILEGIPVERASDLAFEGSGEVWLSPEDRASLQGRATKFREQERVRGIEGALPDLAARAPRFPHRCTDCFPHQATKH